MNLSITPQEFIETFQSHHPDTTSSEALTLLAILCDTSINFNKGKGMTAQEIAEDTVRQAKQFMYDLPLSQENYDNLMSISRRVILDQAYANS